MGKWWDIQQSWTPVGENNRNLRCFTENWGNNPKTYLECECKTDAGDWRNNRVCLDDHIVSGGGGSAFSFNIGHTGRPDKLSTNLASPNPTVSVQGTTLVLRAHCHGASSPEWRDINMKDWLVEDGLLFPRCDNHHSWSPKMQQYFEDRKSPEQKAREAEQRRKQEEHSKEWHEKTLPDMKEKVATLKKQREEAVQSGQPSYDIAFYDDSIAMWEQEISKGYPGMPVSRW